MRQVYSREPERGIHLREIVVGNHEIVQLETYYNPSIIINFKIVKSAVVMALQIHRLRLN